MAPPGQAPRPPNDVLKLEGDVARAIAQEIRIQITPEERNRLAVARRITPAAQEAYLLGRYHKWKLNEQDLRQGIEAFEQAIQLEPDFASAYAGLGTAWRERGVWGAKGFREVEDPARKALLKALALDPSLSEAHAGLAEILSSYDWNWSAAEQEYRRAIDLDSNNLEARAYYATFLMAYALVMAGYFGGHMIIDGRLEIREKGIVSKGKLLRWGNIESYEWTEVVGWDGKPTLGPLKVRPRRLLKALPPTKILVPAKQREAVDAVLSRYLSDWPGAASGGIQDQSVSSSLF